MLARLILTLSMMLTTCAIGVADELPLLVEEDFEKGAERWEPLGESQWTIIEQDGNKKYRAEGKRVMVAAGDTFRAGAIEIQWLGRRLAALTAAPAPRGGVVRAAVAAVLLAERDRNQRRLTPGSSAQAIASSESPTAWLELARREGLR